MVTMHSRLPTVLVFALVASAYAVPQSPAPQQVPMGAEFVATTTTTPCEDVEKFTTEWFLDNTKPEFKGWNIRLENALFYSEGMTAKAQEYAKNEGMTTIWDVWPCQLYDHRDVPENPMRCIFNSDRRTKIRYFAEMSRAFAQKAKDLSTVLHSAENFAHPPENGLWYLIEFPTLKASGDVDWLAKIKEDTKICEVFWRSDRRIMEWASELLRCPERKRVERRTFDDGASPDAPQDDAYGIACPMGVDVSAFDDLW